VTGAVFAQVPDGLSFGGWGRADFVPVQGVFVKDLDPVFLTGVGSGWGPAYTGINIRFSAADGRIGGGADIGRGTGGPANGDELNIWAKPFGSDILEIKVGQTRDGRFRGPGTDGNFQGFIGGPGHNGDAVFQRFAPNAGALFVSKPIENLSIFAQLDTGKALTGIGPGIKIDDGDADADDPLGAKAKDIYKKIQAGFAYDISGIGLLRAQWVGDSMDITDVTFSATKIEFKGHPARVEAAFKLTAIEGLNLDVGFKIPLPINDDESLGGAEVTYNDNFQVAVAGDFKSGDFGIAYGLYGGFGGKTAVKDGKDSKKNLTFDVIVVPSFYVAAIDATVGADVGLKAKGESTIGGDGQKDQEIVFGLGGWISRDLGKGSIKTGLAYQLPPSKDNTAEATSYFSWPIILEVSF
jgi:hypothetical protein